MKESITIRRGKPGDLPDIVAIGETAAHWRPEEYERIFDSRRVLLVAERGGAVLGFAVTHNIVGEWELENIAVGPAHRRGGVGHQLLSALITEAKEQGAKAIFLEVRESNRAATLLYERCGFQQCGRRKSYYSNPSEDGLLYRLLCNSAALENC